MKHDLPFRSKSATFTFNKKRVWRTSCTVWIVSEIGQLHLFSFAFGQSYITVRRQIRQIVFQQNSSIKSRSVRPFCKNDWTEHRHWAKQINSWARVSASAKQIVVCRLLSSMSRRIRHSPVLTRHSSIRLEDRENTSAMFKTKYIEWQCYFHVQYKYMFRFCIHLYIWFNKKLVLTWQQTGTVMNHPHGRMHGRILYFQGIAASLQMSLLAWRWTSPRQAEPCSPAPRRALSAASYRRRIQVRYCLWPRSINGRNLRSKVLPTHLLHTTLVGFMLKYQSWGAGLCPGSPLLPPPVNYSV